MAISKSEYQHIMDSISKIEQGQSTLSNELKEYSENTVKAINNHETRLVLLEEKNKSRGVNWDRIVMLVSVLAMLIFGLLNLTK